MSLISGFKKKVLVSCVVLGLSSTYSAPSHAGIPVIDGANLGEAISSNIERAMEWAQETAMHYAGMDLEALLAELSIDNLNNAIGNVIVRSGKTSQDIQNKDILMKSVPDKDGCSTLTTQILNEEVNCQIESKVNSAVRAHAKKHNNYGSGVSDNKVMATVLIDKLYEKCKELSDGEADEDNPLSATMCTNTGLLIGVGSGDTRTEKETEAAAEVIKIITGVVPEFKKSSVLAEGSELQKEQIIEEMKREAYRSAVAASLFEISSLRESPGGGDDAPLPSPLEVLEQYNKQRFGSSDWITSVANNAEDTKNSIYGPEIVRKMAAMDAFQVNLGIMKYKQQLRMEALLALSLMYQVDPPQI